MQGKEIIVYSQQEVIQLIRSFDNDNEEMSSVARQLADIIARIPKESIHEIYAKITEENLLKMGVRHHNDRFRLVQILIGNTIVGITACSMKDTLNFQLENGRSSFNSISELATPYFESVFGKRFEKVITYRKGELFKCEMKFDDTRFTNRLYTTRKSKIMSFFGFGRKKGQHFRYLSFFEVYDYFVKNEIIEQPGHKTYNK